MVVTLGCFFHSVTAFGATQREKASDVAVCPFWVVCDLRCFAFQILLIADLVATATLTRVGGIQL